MAARFLVKSFAKKSLYQTRAGETPRGQRKNTISI
jgi:hypothetical protein